MRLKVPSQPAGSSAARPTVGCCTPVCVHSCSVYSDGTPQPLARPWLGRPLIGLLFRPVLAEDKPWPRCDAVPRDYWSKFHYTLHKHPLGVQHELIGAAAPKRQDGREVNYQMLELQTMSSRSNCGKVNFQPHHNASRLPEF